jgi:hypothetical protein
MASGSWGWVVNVCGAGVQNVGVGDELDVADFEDHVESETLAGGFEDLESLFLGVGERGDEARVREAGEGADVVGVPSGWY